MPALNPPTRSVSLSSAASAAGQGLLIGLLAALCISSLIGLGLTLVYVIKWSRHGRILLNSFGQPGVFDDEEENNRLEAEHLHLMTPIERRGHEDGQGEFSPIVTGWSEIRSVGRPLTTTTAFLEQNNSDLVDNSISLHHFMLIQEKGVRAWEFIPEFETVPIVVDDGTEIDFYGSTPCSVQTNLPIPQQHDVYYWEAKVSTKPDPTTIVSIGVATKPYPNFRLPGYHRQSFGYRSDGKLFMNQPFKPLDYTLDKEISQGDVIGVGYQPRRRSIFFTWNGKRHAEIPVRPDVNWFPTIGATGPCQVMVNLGQAGFVFIEANVKKWGLASTVGTRPPPPPYGSEHGRLLATEGTYYVPVGSSSSGPHQRLPCPSPGPSPGPSYSNASISLTVLPSVDSHRHYQISSAGLLEPASAAPPNYDTLLRDGSSNTQRESRNAQPEASSSSSAAAAALRPTSTPLSPPISYEAMMALENQNQQPR